MGLKQFYEKDNPVNLLISTQADKDQRRALAKPLPKKIEGECDEIFSLKELKNVALDTIPFMELNLALTQSPFARVKKFETLVALKLEIRRHELVRIHHCGHADESGNWRCQDNESICLADLVALAE